MEQVLDEGEERDGVDRRPAVVAGVLSLVLAAAAAIALVSVGQAAPVGNPYPVTPSCFDPGLAPSTGPLIDAWVPEAVVLLAGAVLCAVLAARWSSSAWAMVPTAAVGLTLVLAGTGLGRPYVLVAVDRQPMSCQSWLGPQVQPAWMVAGAVVCVVALMLGVHRRRMADARWAAVGVLVLAVVGTGVVAWSSTLAERVIGSAGYSGRPVRDRGRRRREPAAAPAERWRRAAVDEHMAATAFEGVARDLERLGAPTDLVGRCRSAAADERRHARTCLALAGASGAPLPEVSPPAAVTGEGRTAALVRVALEAHVDGVVNEGRAAAELRRTAVRLRASGEVARATVVDGIAADEERHAALNGDIVRWCRSELRGPADVLVRAVT